MYTARPRGLSLVETMVASSLLMLVLTVVYFFVNQGYQFFRVIQASSESQREALALLTKLNSVVQNSKSAYIYVDPGSKGLAYCSPFDDSGRVTFDISTSQTNWQAYESIFLMPDQKVYQGRHTIAAATSVPPPDVAGYTPASFITIGKGKFIAEKVSLLNITEYNVGDDLPLSGATGGKAATKCYGFQIDVGDANNPSGYWLRLESLATPRNG